MDPCRRAAGFAVIGKIMVVGVWMSLNRRP